MGAAQPAPRTPTAPLIQQPRRLHRALRAARRHPELDPWEMGSKQGTEGLIPCLGSKEKHKAWRQDLSLGHAAFSHPHDLLLLEPRKP